jgi:hypothetical protein
VWQTITILNPAKHHSLALLLGNTYDAFLGYDRWQFGGGAEDRGRKGVHIACLLPLASCTLHLVCPDGDGDGCWEDVSEGNDGDEGTERLSSHIS